MLKEDTIPQAQQAQTSSSIGRNRLLTTIDHHTLILNFAGGLSRWTAERGMVCYWLQAWKEVVGVLVGEKLYVRLTVTSGDNKVHEIDRTTIQSIIANAGVTEGDNVVICDSNVWRWVESQIRVIKKLPDQVRNATYRCDAYKGHIILPQSPVMDSWEKTGEMICPICHMNGEINGVSPVYDLDKAAEPAKDNVPEANEPMGML